MEIITVVDAKSKRVYHVNLNRMEYLSPLGDNFDGLRVKHRDIYANLRMSGEYALYLDRESYDKVIARLKEIKKERTLH